MKITLSQVVVRIGSKQVILFRIPKFEVAAGEHILIKGASGKGKTTFLHMLAGLFPPDEGTVRLGDMDLSHMNDEERSLFRQNHLGIIFQKLNLIDHLTALENILLSSPTHLPLSHSWSGAQQSLQSVGLAEKENHRTSVLSLGEQQRVAIARVLNRDTKMVLADEPTSSLDERNTFEVMDLLQKSCHNKTFIVVSHDHRIEKYFSRICDFGDLTV